MKISAITVHRVELPLASPYRLSGGRLLFERLDSTIVRVDTDEGVHGWGEVCPWGSSYLPMHGAGVRAAMEELAPAVLGCDPRRLDVLDRVMGTTLPGHLYARTAIDAACWDVLGRAAGIPVVELLGGREVEHVPVASSVPTDAPDAMLAEVRAYRARGYRFHSVKIGSGVADDVARIEALSADEQSDEVIFYDVNRAWLPRVAISVMNAVQTSPSGSNSRARRSRSAPSSAVARCSRSPSTSRSRRRTICCERGTSAPARSWTSRSAASAGSPARGGCAISRSSSASGSSWEDTGGSILADTAATHLASTVPARSLIASWSCQELVTVDPAPGQGARVVDGRMRAPDLPGLGVEPDPDVLGPPVARYTAVAP